MTAERHVDSLRRAAVLGAGTMGHGIAQVCAQAGMHVVLSDVSEEAVARGIAGIRKMLDKAVEKGKTEAAEAAAVLARVSTSTSVAAACAGVDVVIEAVPENLDLKRKVFAEAAAAAGPQALLASNTSSISIDAIAQGVDHPQRFLGLHFFNPVPLMALLEVVRGAATSEATVDLALGFAKRLGKEPIVVRDAPGFASSRLGVAIGLEAMRMVEEGVASPADIDKAMELGYRHPMGPLKLTDLVGLDVRLGIAEYLASKLGARFEPPQLLRDKVAAEELGRKSGRGFYDWS